MSNKIADQFAQIAAEPSATIRKFKLIKAFPAFLPENAKTLSADQIAEHVAFELHCAGHITLDIPNL